VCLTTQRFALCILLLSKTLQQWGCASCPVQSYLVLIS
jgi:hypothetical protein